MNILFGYYQAVETYYIDFIQGRNSCTCRGTSGMMDHVFSFLCKIHVLHWIVLNFGLRMDFNEQLHMADAQEYVLTLRH